MFWYVLLLLLVLIPLLAIVLDSQVGKAMAARLENGGAGRDGDLLQERIRFLESELERLSAEVDRLSEEGEFLHKLLAERPPPEDRAGRLFPGPAERAPEAGDDDG